MSVPESVAHYRIVKKLGEGGMGTVYLADDLVLERKVAIKILPSDFAADRDRVERFRREAKAISALNHRNIVTIHEYGEENGIPFFVTEFLGHRTLRDLMRDRQDLLTILPIMIEIVRGVAAAHAAGVVHRDIKPENVMVSGPLVKIVDFGLARRSLDLAKSDLQTHAGTIMGTFPYMSPEQLRGEDIDAQSDIFSLGVLLYEWICGRRPFEGSTVHDVTAAILTREPSPVDRSHHVPEQLEVLLSRMLSKERHGRPTAAEVLGEVEAIASTLTGTTAAKWTSAQGMTDVQPVAQVQPAKANLPAEPGPLIGREREVSAVLALLRRADVRIVTLTGLSGTGKTRVALAAAQRIAGTFRDGVFFLPLEAINQPELVTSSIAQSLGIREQLGRSIASTLADDLRKKELLLLLDSFEHISDAAPTIGALAADAGGVKFLITSQAPLRIRHEHEYSLDPLPVPAERATAAALEANPSVELFLAAAQRVKPDLVLTASNAPAVAEICRRLEGVPLAIELAAVRVKLLSPEAILARLADPLSFLTGGPRDLPARQQALRDALAWSAGLLNDEERSLLAKLTVFHGGWSVGAVERVCSSASGDTIELLGSLVDKSLVKAEQSDDIDPRFTMLVATRAFAQQLLSVAERDEVALRHLAYFVELAEEAERGFAAATQSYWIRRFDADQNNFRTALQFAAKAGRHEERLRIAASLWKFWNLRGQFTEGRQILEGAFLAAGRRAPIELQTRALVGIGVLADSQGDYEAARKFFEQNLELCRAAKDAWGVPNSLNNLAVVAVHAGDLERARLLHQEALRGWRSLDHRPAVALSLQNLGNVAQTLRRHDEARELFEESLDVFRSLDDQRGIALSLQHLATLERDAGDHALAIQRCEQALEIFMTLGDHWNVASCMADLGGMYRLTGDRSQAHSLLSESLMIFHELGDAKHCAIVMEALAFLAAGEPDVERALILGGAATAIRKSIGAARTGEERRLFDSSVGALQQQFGSVAAEAWQRGERMSLQESIDFALQ